MTIRAAGAAYVTLWKNQLSTIEVFKGGVGKGGLPIFDFGRYVCFFAVVECFQHGLADHGLQ
jgi:hypothetical protein